MTTSKPYNLVQVDIFKHLALLEPATGKGSKKRLAVMTELYATLNFALSLITRCGHADIARRYLAACDDELAAIGELEPAKRIALLKDLTMRLGLFCRNLAQSGDNLAQS